MCSKKIPGIKVDHHGEFEISLVDGDPGEITAAISRGGENIEGVITMSLQKDTDSVFCEVYENLEINYPVESIDYPNIWYLTPHQCNWFRANLEVYGMTLCDPETCLFSYTVPPLGVPGDIPVDDSFNEELVKHPQSEISLDLTENLIAPGQKLILKYYYDTGDSQLVITAGARYYDVPALTTGVILSIPGDVRYDDNVQIYVQGFFGDNNEPSQVICRRTDWVEWEVGDWVYVLRDFNRICPMQVGPYYDGEL